MIVLLVLLALFYAWRYASMEIDPDWAMFNFAAFTGAWYGRDFADCKTPAIHLWYYAIARIVGRNVWRVRFTHHILTSLPGLIVGYENFWAGLAFIVLVQSGQLLAFHGNVGQAPAGLLLLAMWVANPWVSMLLIGLALLFEPKLLPAGLLLVVSSPQRLLAALPLSAAPAVAAFIMWKFYPQVWAWMVESNITIPKRMVDMRKELIAKGLHHPYPEYLARSAMFVAPGLALAVMNRPDPLYWAAPVAFVLFMAVGRVVRNNHLIPLAPWIALACGPAGAIAIFVADMVGGGLYIGDLWMRFYNGIRNWNIEARLIGEWLKDKPGDVWMNTLHSAILIFAERKPFNGMAEQIEICQNAHERREVWRDKFKANPPRYIVTGPEPGWNFTGIGYRKVAETAGHTFAAYERT